MPSVPAVSADQRGLARKSLLTDCDAGAFEETFVFNPTTLPSSLVNVPYPVQTFAVSSSFGSGTGPFTFVKLNGTLPPGLTLNGATLSGTPTTTGLYHFTIQATDANGLVGTNYYTIAVSVSSIDTIGIYRKGTFYFRWHNTTGVADFTFSFTAGTKPYPIVGDWRGLGFDTVGVYDRSNGQFTLCTEAVVDTCLTSADRTTFVLGVPSDLPLSGRWSLSATTAGVGVFRPSNGLIYLKDALTTGYADHTMVLGIPGDVGLAGDWNGKGYDSPGAYRPSNSTFYLSNQVNNGSVIGDYQVTFGLGGDAPVVGDWIAQGHDGIGLFRQSNGFTYLKNQLVTGYADNAFTFGIADDIPVAGHWVFFYPPVPLNPPPVPNGTSPQGIAKTAVPLLPDTSVAGGNSIGD